MISISPRFHIVMSASNGREKHKNKFAETFSTASAHFQRVACLRECTCASVHLNGALRNRIADEKEKTNLKKNKNQERRKFDVSLLPHFDL